VAYAGVDLLTGRPRYHRETVKTYDDAKKALVRLQSEIAEAIDQWLDVAKLEDTTRERYQDLIRLFILPTFGHLRPQSSAPSYRRGP